MKQYFWFNIMCISISLFFIGGTVFVYVRTYERYEITNYEISLAIIDKSSDNKTIKQLNHPTIQPLNNNVASTTKDNVLTELPKQYLLSVPFTSQAPEKNWDQPWQDACEEAALLMLDAYYKNYNLSPLFARDEMLKMVAWEEARGWGNSIEMEKVKQMAEEYFLLNHLITTSPDHLRIIENPTVDDIKKFIVAGNPVLVVADGKVLPNPHFRNGGPVYHALVIKGYDEENFITNDPGTQFGEGFKYKYNDLMKAIRDWNEGDVSAGKKVVLVVEDLSN